jgi:flagellar protein FliO/FliZ
MANPGSPLSPSSLTQLTLSLLLVVALIFLISWVIKRFRIAAPRGKGDIVILDQLALSPRDRILLVKVGDAQLLVGVGTSGMVALTPLAAPITQAPTAAAPVFADRMRELMKWPGNKA